VFLEFKIVIKIFINLKRISLKAVSFFYVIFCNEIVNQKIEVSNKKRILLWRGPFYGKAVGRGMLERLVLTWNGRFIRIFTDLRVGQNMVTTCQWRIMGPMRDVESDSVKISAWFVNFSTD